MIVGILIAAVIFWQAFFKNGGGHTSQTKEEAKRQIYHCPMHPSYTSARPGSCPICGMDFVPMEINDSSDLPQSSSGAGDSRVAVQIDGARVERAGLKTASVRRGEAAISIRAAGLVAFDPDLLVAQREFIEARRVGDGELAAAARTRLKLMGLGPEEIDALGGKPDTSLILPETNSWVYASIYERELPYVRIGQAAKIELPDGAPVGSGKIRAIDPVLDPQTRTARVRIEVPNAAMKLKPNMFVVALIQNDLGEGILVPKSAVIDTGTRKIVFLVHEGNRFIPQEVSLGLELKDDFVVDSGVEEGEMVATGALFLIDSESQIKAAASAMGGHKHD